MSIESVEASLVMLGDKPALVARPLPQFIDFEDVETQNGITLLKKAVDAPKIEAWYDIHIPALRYVRRKE